MRGRFQVEINAQPLRINTPMSKTLIIHRIKQIKEGSNLKKIFSLFISPDTKKSEMALIGLHNIFLKEDEKKINRLVDKLF